MYQVETDSEDDYECLFLKPVDGYNISDRIRQANEELFASPGPESPSVIPRKVTFRKVLEEFDDGGDNLSIVSVESLDANGNSKDNKSKENLLKHIPEEKEGEDDDEENRAKQIESETEEICEEIVEIQLDSVKSISNSYEAVKNSAVQSAKVESKSTTIEETQKTTKSRPHTPPLPTLQEERDSSIKLKEISLNSPYSSVDKTTITPSSSEDDLSVIVASYVPEGLEVIEEKSTDENNGTNKKAKSKKFSFRRKKKLYSPPPLPASESKQQQKSSNSNASKKSNQNLKNSTTNDIDAINFHYKTCCEYKNAVDSNSTLPKYTGYLSEYGLSKEQIEKREKKLEKQQKYILEKNMQATESQIQKMDDNERAFTRWLKNKMRFPVNKTKNMFDFHQSKNAAKKAKS